MVAWNKAYRREFVEREGFTFPPGYYEDTPWTYPVLMTAESIATLDRVCVHYRQRRRGSILRTTSARHFDVFDQYDRVFAYRRPAPRTRPVAAGVVPPHGRPPGDRVRPAATGCRAAAAPTFLRRARAHYRRYRTPGTPVPLRARVHHALIRLGLHRTYRALQLASRPAPRHREDRREPLLQGLRYRRPPPATTGVQRCLPLRADRAVFAAYGGRGHGCNPGALEAAFRDARAAHPHGLGRPPEHHHAVPAGDPPPRPGTAAYWTALARSRYLVSNADFDRRLVKRRGQVLIQTRQGTPLGHMGLDLQERPAAARGTDFAGLLRERRPVGLRAVRQPPLHPDLGARPPRPLHHPGVRLAPATTSSRRRPRPTWPGCARSLGIPEGTVAILYAPTHRDYRRTQRRRPRPASGSCAAWARASSSWPAPTTPTTPRSTTTRGRVVDVSDHPSVESLCLASDALVTDYSSLMFDFANLDRPIVIHADDWEAYEAARGTYFDLRASPPGAGRARRGRADRHLRHRPLARLSLDPAAVGVPRAVLPVRRRTGRRAGRAPGRARGVGAAARRAARRAPPGAVGGGLAGA